MAKRHALPSTVAENEVVNDPKDLLSQMLWTLQFVLEPSAGRPPYCNSAKLNPISAAPPLAWSNTTAADLFGNGFHHTDCAGTFVALCRDALAGGYCE